MKGINELFSDNIRQLLTEMEASQDFRKHGSEVICNLVIARHGYNETTVKDEKSG